MGTSPVQTTHSILLRLHVIGPPAGVRWAVQLGRTDLLGPVARAVDRWEFEIPLEVVSVAGGEAKVRGQAMQGPKGGRFVYVTSGKRAGDVSSPWDRRAKVSLETLPLDAIRRRPADRIVELEGEIPGTAKDGGPTCASTPLMRHTWRLVT